MKVKLMKTLVIVVMFSFLNMVLADEPTYDQFKLDLLLAKRGDAGAQFYVASAYEEGRGVKKDINKAIGWYSKAAKNNHNGAQYKLGEFYEKGLGLKKDITKAGNWYKKAAANGSRLAKARLAKASSGKKINQGKAKLQAAEKKKEDVRKRRLAEESTRQEKEKKKKQHQDQLAAARAAREKDRRAKQQKLVKAKRVSKKALTAISIPDIMDVVLHGQWSRHSRPAGLLPSSLNRCLKAGEKEIVCFSKEQYRIVGNSQLTFTSKTTLSDFNSKGQFTITYFYNVLDSTSSSEEGGDIDPFGLRAEKGWQEPYLKMACQAKNRKQLRCSRAGQMFVYSR